MEKESSSYLARFAAVTAVFALVIVAIIAGVKGGGGSDDEASVATNAPVAVTVSEFKINPGTIEVPQGGTIEVSNAGSMAHNVEVVKTDAATPDIPAGGSAALDVSSLAPGTYEVFCSVPGHKDSGMTAKLVISEGGSSATGSGDMAGMDHSTTDVSAGGGDGTGSTSADSSSSGSVADMEPGSKEAEQMNARMEKAMTKGVNDFLATAKKYAAGDIKKGNARLEPNVLPDGTKRFDLTAAITDWEVSPGKVVKAWTYNGIVPGPWIKVDPGDKVEIVLKNELPISTDIHFHGIDVPNAMDGVAPITQDYIKPGTTYRYAFTAPNEPELGMYHAHMHGQEAVVNGMFADLQVGDVPLPRGRTISNVRVPANVKIAQEIPMVVNDAGVIGLTLNGKAFPATEPIVANKGDWILIDYFNEGLQGHPMHLHRQHQLVVSKDGYPLEQPYRVDTLWVAPGERYSVLVNADEVGTWAFHCHILSHSENQDGLTGMVTAMIVK